MSDGRELFRTPPPGMTQAGESILPRKRLKPEEALQQIQELEQRNVLRAGLPFLFGWKWYPWARAFYESLNKVNLLCAANQISKSSTQIRKTIHWATDVEGWPRRWRRQPRQFWYLYPTREQAEAEFYTKWRPEFLPQNGYENHPQYGWKPLKERGRMIGIEFNSGVRLYYKTYSQDPQALQTGTCDAIFCDEELDVKLYEELMFRISASDGYFHMVFTATLGQDFWRRALEPGESEEEVLPNAFKQTVTLYDAMYYEDGSPSHWTAEKIAQVRARCSTHQEILKRVYGKFIVLEGRKYPTFDTKRHFKPKHVLPKDWLIYCGADIGSGGERGHPSALAYVAVRPDYRQGRVFLGWRGDKIDTTAGDVVEKHIALKKEHQLPPLVGQYYDHGSRDFFNIATRMGETFQKAEKGHAIGEDVINTLFKNDMLFIYEDEELGKLGQELCSVKSETKKEKAKDDFIDAMRYALTSIPWDFSCITGEPSSLLETPEKPMNRMEREIMERRKEFDDAEKSEKLRLEDEFNEWNEAYGYFE